MAPVPVDNQNDVWQVEAVWDQWLVKLESGSELGPLTKRGLDVWCSEGRLGENTKVLRIDWDDWELAVGVYPDLAIATHRTTNRPVPVQPAPSVAEVMTEAHIAETAEAFPALEIEGESPNSDDEALPDIDQ